MEAVSWAGKAGVLGGSGGLAEAVPDRSGVLGKQKRECLMEAVSWQAKAGP